MSKTIPPKIHRPDARELILSGNVWKAVWFVAWPTAVNTLLLTAYRLINRAFIGRIENATDGLAALGIGDTMLMVQFALIIGLSAGTGALVARFIGSGNMEDAYASTQQSVWLGIVGGVVSGALLIVFATPLVETVGAKGDVVAKSAEYVTIVSWGSVPAFLFMIVTSALRSTGDVRSPLYIGAVLVVINILLDWLLIFGVGPIEPMGVAGAGWATTISRYASLVLLYVFLKRSQLAPAFSNLVCSMRWCRRILNIGWPASIQNILWTGAYAVFIRILADLPAELATAGQAALTVGITIESIAFMPAVAYSMAATPLVGQNLGAKQPERAQHSAWVATGQACFIMTCFAVLFFLAPHYLAGLFTTEKAVVPHIATYLMINAVAEPFLGLNIVLRGALQGAGDTRVPAWITFLTHWAVRLPLAWFLAVHMGYGIAGAWYGMSASAVLSGIMTAGWFVMGKWKTQEV